MFRLKNFEKDLFKIFDFYNIIIFMKFKKRFIILFIKK